MEQSAIREKEFLCHLDHPFILQLVESYQDEHNLYLLLPVIPGGELYEYLQKNKTRGRGLGNDSAAFYAACTIEALGHLHQRRIAFRDLKLENILIDEDGYGKIVDLGFAKVVDDKTWTLCGTPEYLAPELILSKGHDQAVDYWAFGVVVCELLVGTSPFYMRGSSQTDMFKRIVLMQYDIPEYVDECAASLIQQLLVRKQTERLGNLANGYFDIKNHPWFRRSDICFRKLIQKELQAPWKPEVNKDAWDRPIVAPLRMQPRETGRRLTKQEQEVFKGF
jgi:protein kinase A